MGRRLKQAMQRRELFGVGMVPGLAAR